MHIPDGYLSPQTYIPAYGVMIPLWTIASRKLKKTLRSRQAPMLAIAAAFCFVVMMFNIPIPGGTTGHATGAVLIAILLGPWAAMISVSLALIVQALLFGDGGVTAIGANCFNMAVVMPLAGWGVYRLIAGSAPAKSARHKIGGAVGGYIGLCLAALTTAIMFGIQPIIAHGADGRALYCPFGLKVAVPVMLAEHLLLFGFVEAAVTALVIAYIQKIEPSMIARREPRPPNDDSGDKPGGRGSRRALTFYKRLTLGLLLLALLSPLGLYLPAKFGAGSAWGEWSASEIQKLAGYIPCQFKSIESIWKAPLPDYTVPGGEAASAGVSYLWYVVSAILGIGIIVIVSIALRKVFIGKEPDVTAGVDAKSDKN